MVEKDPYTFSKALITNSNFNKKFHQEEEKKIYTKKDPRLTFRKMPRMKSAIIIQAEKELKKVTLSSQSYSQYMKINKKIIRQFAFKGKKSRIYSSMGDLTGRRNQNQNNKNKNLPNLTYKKSDINEFINERKNINHYNSERNKDINIIDNDSLDDINSNEENENNNIEEMPYGFKYKNTRIILDKDKLGPIKSAIFPDDNKINNIYDDEFKNITNIKEIKKEKKKEKEKKYILKDILKKKEEEKNDKFKFFFDGDFLEKNKKLLKQKNKTEFILKYEESNNCLADLYDICKNIEKFNGKDFQRKMIYNIKNNNHTEEFDYDLTLNSLCLKFIEQNKNKDKNLDGNIKEKSHKVFLPFTYLLFFYLLDFETFKVFLSEIIIYNVEKGEMEINQKEIRNILIKYKKYIQFILGPYFNPGKNKDIDNIEFYQRASYNWNEKNFLKIYDWIVHIKSGNNKGPNIQNKNNNNNIIYKVKIILPMIKFNLITKKVVIKKLIHKNIITKLLKNGLKKWEEKILCELFFNKKFRYIINGIFSKNYQSKHFYNKRKIYLDKIDYNNNILNRSKYEFFITDAKREHSQYLYISSYEILFFYGRNQEKFNIHKHMSIKDSINLNKYSLYWGYMNTIMKCLHIDKKNKKVLFDFNILEKDPAKYFQLKLKTKIGLGIMDKNHIENLNIFYNQGYMFYRKEELLVDMYFINFIIIEPCITRLNLQKYKFRVPKDLLDIITNDKNAIHDLNSYISMFSEEILSNNGILNLNFEDFKRRVDNKNLSKGMQERLKRFSLGLINKSNTIKVPSSAMNENTDIKKTNSNFKRGVSSGGMGSLFGNSLLNIVENYKKSETKKFGGSLFVNNNNKIDETKTMENKKAPKKLSIWNKVKSLKKHEKDEIQEIKEIKEPKEIQEKKLNRQISFFNPVNINVIENDSENNTEDKKIKEEKEKEKEKKKKYKKMNTKMKSKFIEKGEYFKQYMDDVKKQSEVKYIDVEGNELFK